MPAPAPAQFRLLVVDDEDCILELVAEILGREGWTVETCSSPVKALRLARLGRYDALILDLYMPELPGMLFHAKLKVFDPELARRTLFVTGHFSREELKRDLVENAAVLMKPFKPALLVEFVSRALPAEPRRLVG